MRAVILQPSYVPWRGVFQQLLLADVFVFYDDVQYDARGWRNRNRVKTAQGPRWLTIPVHQTRGVTIREVSIDWSQDWPRKHVATLRHAYARAPYLDAYLPLLEEHLARRPALLADLTIDLTLALGRALGIETRTLRASALGVTGAKTERLLAICRRLGATRYLSGPSAKDYLDEAQFARAGVAVEWVTYDHPEYPQLHPPYDAHVSVLDLLFMQGPAAGALIPGRPAPP